VAVEGHPLLAAVEGPLRALGPPQRASVEHVEEASAGCASEAATRRHNALHQTGDGLAHPREAALLAPLRVELLRPPELLLTLRLELLLLRRSCLVLGLVSIHGDEHCEQAGGGDHVALHGWAGARGAILR